MYNGFRKEFKLLLPKLLLRCVKRGKHRKCAIFININLFKSIYIRKTIKLKRRHVEKTAEH